MSGPLVRIGGAFHLSSRSSWLVVLAVLAGLAGLLSVAAVVTRMGMLPAALALVVAAIVTMVGFRWPLLTLALFAAFIPIEEVLLIDGVGTLSRFAAILFAVTYGLPRLTQLRLGVMPRAGWAYVGWAALSLGWAVDASVAWAQLATLVQLFLIAVLVADFVVLRPEIVRPVLWVYSVSAAGTAAAGIWSYLTQGIADTRAVAIQGQDPAQFAAVLLPALFFGLHQVLYGRQRMLGAAVLGLTSIGILVSGTRGAWLAVGAVLLVFLLPRITAGRRMAVIAAILVVLGGAYQIPGMAALLTERAGNAISTGGAGRTDIWEIGLAVYQSAPLAGVGYANFPVAYKLDTVRSTGAVAIGLGSHSLLIGTLVELGAVGMVLIAIFLLPLVLRLGWGPDAMAIQMALASLMVSGLFLDILANRKQVWLVIGLAAGLAFVANMKRRAEAMHLAADLARPGEGGSARATVLPPDH